MITTTSTASNCEHSTEYSTSPNLPELFAYLKTGGLQLRFDVVDGNRILTRFTAAEGIYDVWSQVGVGEMWKAVEMVEALEGGRDITFSSDWVTALFSAFDDEWVMSELSVLAEWVKLPLSHREGWAVLCRDLFCGV